MLPRSSFASVSAFRSLHTSHAVDARRETICMHARIQTEMVNSMSHANVSLPSSASVAGCGFGGFGGAGLCAGFAVYRFPLHTGRPDEVVIDRFPVFFISPVTAYLNTQSVKVCCCCCLPSWFAVAFWQ